MNTNSGYWFIYALTLMLIGFKLAGIIKISWLWVLSPMWIPSAIILVVALICWLLSMVLNK